MNDKSKPPAEMLAFAAGIEAPDEAKELSIRFAPAFVELVTKLCEQAAIAEIPADIAIVGVQIAMAMTLKSIEIQRAEVEAEMARFLA